MAFEVTGSTLPAVTAAADLSAQQFRFVKITAAKAINLAGAGDAVAGVLQNKPISGQAATVWGVGSVSKVVAGAAVAAGAFVTPDASGDAVTAGTGNYIAGEAIDAAAGAGSIISVQLTQPGRSV